MNKGEKVVVRKEMLKEGFQRLGLGRGDLVMVHSSLSSFGYVEVVGKEGTILMPTFNPKVKIFDPLTTPSAVGKITEVFRKREGGPPFTPSYSPLCFLGKWAEYLIKDHEETHGIDSPLGKLARKGGYVLMLGAPLSANTSIHIAETIERVPCMEFGKRVCWIRIPEGEIIQRNSVLHREKGCPLFGERESRNILKKREK